MIKTGLQTGLAVLMVVGLSACGGMTHSTATEVPKAQISGPSGRSLSVKLSTVSNRAKIPKEMLDSVVNFAGDQTALACEQHPVFEWVEDDAALAAFGGTQIKAPAAQAAATMEVQLLEVKERLGGTIKVGLVSKQSKYATAKVRLILNRPGQPPLVAEGRGKAKKGAWGAIASVQRSAMKKKGSAWDLDNSMLGNACTLAIHQAAYDLAQQVRQRLR